MRFTESMTSEKNRNSETKGRFIYNKGRFLYNKDWFLYNKSRFLYNKGRFIYNKKKRWKCIPFRTKAVREITKCIVYNLIHQQKVILNVCEKKPHSAQNQTKCLPFTKWFKMTLLSIVRHTGLRIVFLKRLLPLNKRLSLKLIRT